MLATNTAREVYQICSAFQFIENPSIFYKSTTKEISQLFEVMYEAKNVMFWAKNESTDEILSNHSFCVLDNIFLKCLYLFDLTYVCPQKWIHLKRNSFILPLGDWTGVGMKIYGHSQVHIKSCMTEIRITHMGRFTISFVTMYSC